MRTLHTSLASVLLTFAHLVMNVAGAELPFVLRHTLLDPRGVGRSHAQHGSSVAVGGGFAVVGVPREDLAEKAAGVVRVYDAATGGLKHTLANPRPGLADHFGHTVALAGARLVVGTPYSDGGVVYVYDLAGKTPIVPSMTLHNPNPSAADEFGCVVAASGSRVVIGASFESTHVPFSGAAYVYDLAGATPTKPVVKLEGPTPGGGSRFGRCVAISGTRVVVGAPYAYVDSLRSGKAFLFDVASRSPKESILTLLNPDPTGEDLFGSSLAIWGTIVAVGAPYDDAGATNTGSVYVYDIAGQNAYKPFITLHNPRPGPEHYFGFNVALLGKRLVVGAHLDDTEARNSGCAYVYNLAQPAPNMLVARLANPKPASEAFFGLALALDAETILIGAPYPNAAPPNSGAAYLFGKPRR